MRERLGSYHAKQQVTDSVAVPIQLDRHPDTEEVTGSNPVRPTTFFESLSNAESPNGSQSPAVLLLCR